MVNNAQKTPIAAGLQRMATQRASDAIQLLGRALPASVVSVDGAIVTVKFEITTNLFTLPQVTCPLAGSEYIRLPIQAGCKGVVIPADARLGPVSGLGGKTADLSQPANLAALMFLPIGNKGWEAPTNPNELELWGPEGVLIRSPDKQASVEVKNAAVTLKFGAYTVVLDSTGLHINAPIAGAVTGVGGTIDFGGSNMSNVGDVAATTVTAGGVGLTTHHHTGVQTGGGNTGGPVG